ncbi:MAG: hypothetical protein QW491_10300 [Thermoproteota archaeon]
MEKIVHISFANDWNIHSQIGSKYGELFVANELWEHEPKFGNLRKSLKGIEKPTSSDIVLSKTGKKIEVKWGMLHHRDGDYYFDSRGRIPYWGWGFSKGGQFSKNKFDYCVLLAAHKDEARPKYIFVLKLEEMKKYMKPRVSGEAGKEKSFFIETSDEKDFLQKRTRIKPILELERLLMEDRETYLKRWEELKQDGLLK